MTENLISFLLSCCLLNLFEFETPARKQTLENELHKVDISNSTNSLLFLLLDLPAEKLFNYKYGTLGKLSLLRIIKSHDVCHGHSWFLRHILTTEIYDEDRDIIIFIKDIY